MLLGECPRLLQRGPSQKLFHNPRSANESAAFCKLSKALPSFRRARLILFSTSGPIRPSIPTIEAGEYFGRERPRPSARNSGYRSPGKRSFEHLIRRAPRAPDSIQYIRADQAFDPHD
jgi:hypothetical protein